MPFAAASVRTAVCARLGVVGIEPPGGSTDDEDEILSGPDAPVVVMRIRAREDLVIARQTAQLVARDRDA